MRQVGKLNRQVSTQFAQILNGPTCRRGAVRAVSTIYVSASLDQESPDAAVAVERRIVYARGGASAAARDGQPQQHDGP